MVLIVDSNSVVNLSWLRALMPVGDAGYADASTYTHVCHLDVCHEEHGEAQEFIGLT